MIIIPANRICLHMPLPPSTNALQRSTKTGARYNTSEYRAWKKAAGYELISQRQKLAMRSIAGAFGFCIIVPESARSDTDNRGKAALDLLVSLDITQDDRHAAMTAQVASPHIAPGRADVFVWPVQDQRVFLCDDSAHQIGAWVA